MHPGVPFEVLIDPLSTPDHEVLGVKTHLSEVVNADKSEADGGELKVSRIISQMIIRAVCSSVCLFTLEMFDRTSPNIHH